MPQCVTQGCWVLKNSYSFFPDKTVFMCVVDPGVGTNRQALAIQTSRFFFVGPNNGLLTLAVLEDGFVRAVNLPTTEARSSTFHGRDVFAPAAAYIAKLHILPPGEELSASAILPAPIAPSVVPPCAGHIVHIDRFGNIITNITSAPASGVKLILRLELREETPEMPLVQYRTYDEAPEATLFVIVGSSNTYELSVKQSSAEKFLSSRMQLHDPIGLRLQIQQVL
ncbi:SAM-dependent chlorinase/fluorinase [Pelomyxa schiedti]|nr:SAM-dependent chlorinase/fluorinase [Pelomyxa schiedti]